MVGQQPLAVSGKQVHLNVGGQSAVAESLVHLSLDAVETASAIGCFNADGPASVGCLTDLGEEHCDVSGECLRSFCQFPGGRPAGTKV
nr:hypothetical protein [Streptomyces sp. CB02959]